MRRTLAPLIMSGALLVSGCAAEEQEPVYTVSTELESPDVTSQDRCQAWPEVDASESVEEPVEDGNNFGTTSSEQSRTDIAAYFSGTAVDVVTQDIAADGYINDLVVELKPDRVNGMPDDVYAKVAAAAAYITGLDQEQTIMGSGFLMENPVGPPQLLSAGHVMEGLDPASVEMTLNDGTPLEYDYYSYRYNDPWDRAELTYEDKVALSEDIAQVNVCYNDTLEARPLRSRDTIENPLRIGEVIYFANYQEKSPGEWRKPGEIVAYPMLYIGHNIGDERFGNIVGDVQQAVEEDDLRSGGSGGVAVDANGEVVGISVAGVNHYDDPASFPTEWYQCSLPIPAGEAGIVNKPFVDIVIPKSLDECNRGLTNASIRMTQDFGGFLVNTAVERTTEANPNF